MAFFLTSVPRSSATAHIFFPILIRFFEFPERRPSAPTGNGVRGQIDRIFFLFFDTPARRPYLPTFSPDLIQTRGTFPFSLLNSQKRFFATRTPSGRERPNSCFFQVKGSRTASVFFSKCCFPTLQGLILPQARPLLKVPDWKPALTTQVYRISSAS